MLFVYDNSSLSNLFLYYLFAKYFVTSLFIVLLALDKDKVFYPVGEPWYPDGELFLRGSTCQLDSRPLHNSWHLALGSRGVESVWPVTMCKQ